MSRCPSTVNLVGTAVLTLLGLAACESRLLNLGQATSTGDGHANRGGSSGSAGGSAGAAGGGGSSYAIEEPRFEAAKLITELAAGNDERVDENPTLTADLLEIYFNSDRDGGQKSNDVWMARRDSADASFEAPMVVTSVNTEDAETSPAISADGKTLWLGAEREGGLGGRDIWRFTRTGNEPVFSSAFLETNLCSSSDDIPRPLGQQGLVMPLASARTDSEYLTYFGSRKGTSQAFETPTLLSELNVDGYRTTDAFLTNDGLKLYFVRATSETTGDIYVAGRLSVDEPFGAAVALTTVNSDSDERDPWLSLDESVLYFVSDRDGPTRIYRATRVSE